MVSQQFATLLDSSADLHLAGLVLAYTLYFLSQKPTAQRRLREEIASAAPEMHHPPSSDSSNLQDQHLPSPATLDELPYLSAIICESLRMRPNSTPLPRITPANASVRLAGIDGIPPGTRVNAFQWFVHRDPKKWDRVDEWIPERWLDGDGRLLKGSGESQLWGFCSGPRMCAGSNLSQYRQLPHLDTLTDRVGTNVYQSCDTSWHWCFPTSLRTRSAQRLLAAILQGRSRTHSGCNLRECRVMTRDAAMGSDL